MPIWLSDPMAFVRFRFPLWLCLASYVYAITSVEYTTFDSVAQPDTKLRYVSDSGVCETTPGVHQKSGYVDVADTQHIVCPRSTHLKQFTEQA